MGKNNSKNLWYILLLIIFFAGLITSIGCDHDLFENGELVYPDTSFETEIGPEGGVIEVTDLGSSIYGFKIIIPEGALDRNATIIVDEDADAPSLSVGLESSNTIIDIDTDVPLLKEIQLVFPQQSTSDNEDKMLCAFYCDDFNLKWRVVFPESINDNSMTVNTLHFSYWGWGEVLLDEVEIETIEPVLDEIFGVGYMDELETTIETEIEQLNNGGFWDYCENRFAIADFVVEKRDFAETEAEIYLKAVNFWCNVWDHDPTVSDIFYGIEEIIETNLVKIGKDITAELMGAAPFVGPLLEIWAKASAQAWYEQKMGDLKDDYTCIYKNADPELWTLIGVYYTLNSILFVMVLSETFDPCPS
jgi:hypothetical protein